ncbi:hypothetical protein LTR36_002400 [Oleoguttula mirabilis]|uniref:Uncharacterized protein n=1 Tax=Oleoguttula mirabilis TaxID=1507867 RepID=A0AAV9JLD7_9PEZI|nr:hypothetical protein LTR36_002400 [Oleoguttula mirabilis]
MSLHAIQARSLYRCFLRELPSRTPSILANPSPIQQHIRADFASSSPTAPTVSDTSNSSHELASQSLQHQLRKPAEKRLEEAQQYLQYLRAQRQYITLLERYNPGMNMDEEERVRLSARRVGMNLPVEWVDGGKAE